MSTQHDTYLIYYNLFSSESKVPFILSTVLVNGMIQKGEKESEGNMLNKWKMLLFVVVVLLVTSCSSEPVPTSYEEQVIDFSQERYATSYKSFSGEDEIPFYMEEQGTVLVEVNTKSGRLHLYLYDAEDTQRYDPYIEEKRITKQSGENGTLHLQGVLEPGNYLLVVEGSKHEGGYGIAYGE